MTATTKKTATKKAEPAPAAFKCENICQALAAVNREIDAIGKLNKNHQQGFQFRGIDDAYNAMHNVLAANGIVTIPKVISSEYSERETKNGGALFVTKMYVEYQFLHESGSSITVGPVLGEAMDSGDKGANKALAVAHKYALFQTFTIPTLFTDPDADTYEVAPKNAATAEQISAIDDLTDYIPTVTLEWMKGKSLTQTQAAKIIEKAEQVYAKEAAPVEEAK